MAQTYEDRLTLAAFNAIGNEPGSVKLVWGSYVGTGGCGAGHPTKLTFPGKPLYVEVWPASRNDSSVYAAMPDGVTSIGVTAMSCVWSIDWTDNQLSFYATNSNTAHHQMNGASTVYRYLALVGI